MLLSNRRFAPVLLTALSLLSACGGASRNCLDPDEPYLAARNNVPLRIPEGLNQPDRSASLPIPEGSASTSNAASGSGCLAAPPSYFRSSGMVARSPEEVVASWSQAWAARESDAVLALYSPSFVAPTDASGATAWLEQRREQVATGPVPDSMVEGLSVESDGADRRIASFVQKFGSNSLRKQLILVRESGSWRIVEEKVVAVK